MNSVLILILSIPLVEIYLFIKIGSTIGAFNTIALILITAIVGVATPTIAVINIKAIVLKAPIVDPILIKR